MTSSLIRKGLDLFREDLYPEESTEKNKVQSQKKVRVKKKKDEKKLKLKKKKKMMSAVEMYVKNQADDQTENNLAYYLSTSQYSQPNYDMIMKQLKGRMSKDQNQQDDEDTEDASGFTEEDFAKFEKEYR
ncbi:active regulator of SIRT1-like [Antedon mediterranea]|uniref:active regulator of SIRT1-like n=1 Tax=Antedon mediterranea TaxID=105859 RepID=UPI003AF65AC9